ncbi:amino-acid N-acetyltransferase [Leucothrix arctica]|uniref:Amino-acid acetyltransferase n=1 Tax=Leucothrix arctica TaxID=1481894 RepID=A0A317CJH0_9GAMM|nr:amino-acid N-acetyltransferase [Leucothrix arctica]PWQ98725.1 amino-acid N-acetyltransferase [Leucothrix arctica]
MSFNHSSLVGFFREAAPYIHMHRGKTFVIAISGSILQHDAIRKLLSDVALLSTLGARIILVHGARAQIEAQLTAHKHQGIIHNGLRITDDKTLELSKAAIGAARLEIENHLNRALNRPPIVNNSLGIISGNFLTAKPVGVIDGFDHLHTGKVRKVNELQLEQLLENGNIVLLSPLGYSPTGQIYNLRFEEVAGFTASKLKADKLIFIHDKTNLPELPEELNLKKLDEIKSTSNEQMFQEISHAMRNGVERAHLIAADTDGGLLLELYTRDGTGTMIDNSQYDEPREASIDDVQGILDLIRPLEDQGILTKRSREQVELDIANFSIIERDGKVIGCAALYIIEENRSAELACLAIHKDYRSGQRGIKLVSHIIALAKKANVKKLICLTTQSIDWFKERGFVSDSIENLPSHKKALYNSSRKSKVMSRNI